MYTLYANASNIPLLTLMLVRTWYEESTPRGHALSEIVAGFPLLV